jgi:iron-sulfur cluster assembly accessory protein
MNIDFTDDAMVHAIEKIERNKRAGIRFALTGGGCAGFQYEFDYADEPQESDVEIDFGKFKMWVCSLSENYLDGTIISWKRDGLNEGFQFNNPAESASCGCGVSVGF